MKTSIEQLILKHIYGVISPEEQIELENYRNQSEDNKWLVDSLTDRKLLKEAYYGHIKLDMEASLQRLRKEAGFDS